MKIFISIKLQCLLIGILIFKISNFNSQNHDLSNSVFSSNIKSIKKSSNSISFNGSYRFLGYLRNQKEVFPNNNGKTLVILSGDYFREPILLLKMKGQTKDNISFGADFMINSIYKGPLEQHIKTLTLDLGLNLRTTFQTKYGKFNISSGGVSW